MNKQQIEWLPIATLAATAFFSRELLSAWRHSPMDRIGPICFAIWLVPLAVNRFKGAVDNSDHQTKLSLATIGILFSGIITDIKTVYGDRPRGGCQKTGDHPHRSRFASAVNAEQSKALSLANAKRQPVYSRLALLGVLLDEFFDLLRLAFVRE